MTDRSERPGERREGDGSAPAEPLRVAVVGAGVAGLSAACLLSRVSRLGDLQLVLTRPGNASLRGIPGRRPAAA